MFTFQKELINSITVQGKEYRIDMAFDNIIKIFSMLDDKKIPDNVKASLGIQMLFIDIPELPRKHVYEIWTETFKEVFKEDLKQPKYDLKGNVMPDVFSKTKKVMDLEQDSKFIYSSFVKDYGIDLFEHQGKLHWYKFKALLDGLSEDTKLMKVIQIRTMELPKGKGSTKQRMKVEEQKRLYALKEDGE